MSGAAVFQALSIEEQTSRLRRLGEAALGDWADRWRIQRLIKYRENAVFEISNEAGERGVLRVHRNGYHTDAALGSELLWMDALAEAGVAAPRLVRAADGSPFVKASAPDVPDIRQIDIFAWIDGKPLSAITDPLRLEALYHDVGRLAAGMHLQSAAWTLPTGFHRHAWNREGLIGPRALWGDYRGLPALTVSQLALLDRATALADAELIDLEGRAYFLIHADLVADNLLYGSDGLRVIDFDDCGFGWRMFELATALFFHIGKPCYPALERALLTGYRSVAPLPEAEWALLPLFLYVRSLTYLGWVTSRPETETAREGTADMVMRATALADFYLSTKEAAPPVAEVAQ